MIVRKKERGRCREVLSLSFCVILYCTPDKSAVSITVPKCFRILGMDAVFRIWV